MPIVPLQKIIYRSTKSKALSGALDVFGGFLNRHHLSYATGLTRAKATLFSSDNQMEILLAWDLLSQRDNRYRSLAAHVDARSYFKRDSKYEPVLRSIEKIEQLESDLIEVRKHIARSDWQACIRIFESSYFPFFRGEHLAPHRLILEAFNQYLYVEKAFKDTPVHNSHQIYSLEYIVEVGSLIKSLGVKGPILEICAGKGALSKQLRAFGIDIVATDLKGSEGVEEVGHRDALKKHKPELVVGSWVPGFKNIRKERRLNEWMLRMFLESSPENDAEGLQVKATVEHLRKQRRSLDRNEENPYSFGSHKIDLDVLKFSSVRFFLFIGDKECCGSNTARKRYPQEEIDLPHALSQEDQVKRVGKDLTVNRYSRGVVALFKK